MLESSGGGALLTQPERINGEAGQIVSDAWLDKARFLLEEKLAVGSAILAITEARPPLS